MSCRCDFITDWRLPSFVTSCYCQLKYKNLKIIYFKFFSKFICAYLGNCWPIFSQIWICYSWNNTLSALLHLFYNLVTSLWSKTRLKATSPNFASLRVMSMGGKYFSNHKLTWPCTLCRISPIAQAFPLKFWYVVAETLLSSGYGLRFLIRRREHGLICYLKDTLQQNLTLCVIGIGNL